MCVCVCVMFFNCNLFILTAALYSVFCVYIKQEMYEIVGDTVEEDEHFAPQRSRMSQTQLLEHHQILCHGEFRDLTKSR